MQLCHKDSTAPVHKRMLDFPEGKTKVEAKHPQIATLCGSIMGDSNYTEPPGSRGSASSASLASSAFSFQAMPCQDGGCTPSRDSGDPKVFFIYNLLLNIDAVSAPLFFASDNGSL